MQEKHVFKNEMVEIDGKVFWRLYMYYPAHGYVRVVMAPQVEVIARPTETVVVEMEEKQEPEVVESAE